MCVRVCVLFAKVWIKEESMFSTHGPRHHRNAARWHNFWSPRLVRFVRRSGGTSGCTRLKDRLTGQVHEWCVSVEAQWCACARVDSRLS